MKPFKQAEKEDERKACPVCKKPFHRSGAFTGWIFREQHLTNLAILQEPLSKEQVQELLTLPKLTDLIATSGPIDREIVDQATKRGVKLFFFPAPDKLTLAQRKFDED